MNTKYTEFKVVKPLKFENNMKFIDLVRLLNQDGNSINSGWVEIFKNVEVKFFLLKEAYTNAFRLLLLGSKDGRRIAGKVEVDIDGVSQMGTFGNVEKDEYVNMNLPSLGPFNYTVDGDKKLSVEVRWTIYQQQPISVTQWDEKIPESLMKLESLSVVGAAIMKDVSTADISIHCDGKIFKAHKAVLCSRSSVFRAMFQGHMLEATRGEVTVTDVDPGTFAAMLNYVYTGELQVGLDIDLNNMINAAEKYDLPGLKGLLFLRMKSEDIQEELIPDLLIIADKYQAGPLRKLALEKIRANRKIVEEREFQRKLANFQHILFDLLQQL